MKFWNRALLSVVLLQVLSVYGLADTLTFNNGDIISGKITSVIDGKVVFESDMLGKQEIDLAKVKNLTSDGDLPVELKDGTKFSARILSADETSITFDKFRNLPSQKIVRDELAAVNRPEPAKPRWKGDVTAGLSSTHGNSFSENASISANTSLRREKDRTTLGGYYLFGRSKGTDGEKYTTEESFTVNGKYDYYFSKKWYGFINARYKTDHIADLDRRIIAGLGSGYQWIESDAMNFSTDLGLSILSEKYVTGDTETNSDELSLRLGYLFDKKFTDRISFNHGTEYYPSIQSGVSDYFLSSNAEVRINLTNTMYSSFKAILDYDSTPGPSQSSTDTKYIAGIGWSF